MYKYQNVSNQEQSLIGHGVFAPGAFVMTKVALNNPNFKYVGEVKESEDAGAVQAVLPDTNPNKVTDVNPTAINNQQESN